MAIGHQLELVVEIEFVISILDFSQFIQPVPFRQR